LPPKEIAVSHAHSPIPAPRCDPFSHPSNPFNPYFRNCWSQPERRLPFRARSTDPKRQLLWKYGSIGSNGSNG